MSWFTISSANSPRSKPVMRRYYVNCFYLLEQVFFASVENLLLYIQQCWNNNSFISYLLFHLIFFSVCWDTFQFVDLLLWVPVLDRWKAISVCCCDYNMKSANPLQSKLKNCKNTEDFSAFVDLILVPGSGPKFPGLFHRPFIKKKVKDEAGQSAVWI